ncbi:synaptosomal-associated protein 29-like [Oppia nitens]|uniref:synaptosomal-associated protein 29-like n=1 Tax=Oppia nitens TaxID=1686743 RepID=UPI0023DA253B|nr:synaptosomal-associated protein 29-like [Oppia nitens]
MSFGNNSNAINGNIGNQLNNKLDDEVDDMAFLRHPRQGSSGYMLANSGLNSNNENNDWEDKRRQLLAERRAIEERTLESSKVSLGLVYETEKTGIETAEELVRQREQLDNVEEKLDSMNAIMRVSQKHLTSMKSIFGGFKNYFSKSNDTIANKNQNNTIGSRPSVHSESNLINTIDNIRSDATSNSASNHPFFNQRGIDSNGFDFDDNSDNKKVDTNEKSRTKQIDRQLNQNLTEIDLGLGRLKNLALGLGDEIQTQNQQLDRITTKAERSEDTLQHQNRQMKRILKN